MLSTAFLGKHLAQQEKKMSKRLEIYKKYQHSAGVKTLCTILHHQESLDELTVGTAIEMLIQLTDQAMREAGCEINEHGQQNFEDAVYFDFSMSKNSKIELLALCVETDEIADKTAEMIKEIKECH